MEAMASLVFGLSLAVLLAVRCNTQLVYFQQEEYDTARFAKAWRHVRLFDVLASVVLVVALLFLWLATATAKATVWVLLLLAVTFAVIAWREHNYQYKKPLVNTERLRRIRMVALVLLVVFALLATLYLPSTLLALQAVPLAVVVANLVLQPSQQRTNDRFIAEARARLAESSAARIGITGSFGKTTVKHMLAEMLNVGGPVFYSKGSINTVLGLTRHIRQRLQPAHRYIVAEMGAYQIGSIKRLCDFVVPQYGIVTAIGDAHAERFGGLANTAVAKSELAQFVCERGGVLIASEDVMQHEPFKKLQQQYPASFVVVGHAARCDVVISDHQLKDGLWHIQLQFNDQNFTYRIPLLGNHNIMNSALAVALVHTLDAELVPRLATTMPELEQVAHRLELREAAGLPAVLDDAYNSNETGFGNALEVLRKLADEKGGKAVLVTPGIAELGPEHDEVHRRLGELSARFCDVVVVVNPERIPSFIDAYARAPATTDEIIFASTLQEAREKLAELNLSTSDVILYENDLPDLLEERRLL